MSAWQSRNGRFSQEPGFRGPTDRNPKGSMSSGGKEVLAVSDRLGAREQTAVDGVHNRCGAYHPSAEVAAVEALDSVLATLDLVELEVDVALGVGI